MSVVITSCSLNGEWGILSAVILVMKTADCVCVFSDSCIYHFVHVMCVRVYVCVHAHMYLCNKLLD